MIEDEGLLCTEEVKYGKVYHQTHFKSKKLLKKHMHTHVKRNKLWHEFAILLKVERQILLLTSILKDIIYK